MGKIYSITIKNMYRTDILKDEKIKKEYKEGKLTDLEYINQLGKLYYRNSKI